MKPNLLLAEGDAELRHVYECFLAKNGFDVVVARNGLDCLQKLSATKPDLLLLDLELNGGGGDGILAWMREESVRCEVPVILTAKAGCSANGAEDIEPPVVEFLPKPFGRTALLQSVHVAVAKSGHWEQFIRNRSDACLERYIG